MHTERTSVGKHPAFDEFVNTIEALRAPGGCPWDREQTHASIAPNMLEEAYEAVEAIEENNIAHVREELGDVLLQVVLQSQIAQDNGEFTIDDVCYDINQKIIRRHPHVFGEVRADNASDVSSIWDDVKKAERLARKQSQGNESFTSKYVGATTTFQGADAQESLLDSIPVSFPALMQAQKISRKAVSAGFEWDTIEEVWNQVYSEIKELKDAYEAAPKDTTGKVIQGFEVELEMGDVLFSLVNIARKMGIDAEASLRASCRKFRFRWAFIEGAAYSRGLAVEELSLDEMEEFWAEAKNYEHTRSVGEGRQ